MYNSILQIILITIMTSKYASQFLSFVGSSPSPFHAVDSAVKLLLEAGFMEVRESCSWASSQVLSPGKSYFFRRNSSALIAFSIGGNYEAGNGVAILGAHTDSPCLRVKPRSKKEKLGYDQVGVETYGGGIW